jgi:hypothetical protein
MFNFLKTTRGEKGKKKEKGNRVTRQIQNQRGN